MSYTHSFLGQCVGALMALCAFILYACGASHFTVVMLAVFGLVVAVFFCGVMFGSELAASKGGA